MDNAWQVIVVQTRGGQADTNNQQYLARSGLPLQEGGLPLQITIRYGDEKVSTPLVQASQPLWNFWTQLSDRGGSEPMVFSLVERDRASGSFSVKGEARLDLSKFRRHGQSVELWEKLQPTESGKAVTNNAGDATPDLHLTITYCPTKQDDAQGEDMDCLLCTTFGTSQGCVIS